MYYDGVVFKPSLDELYHHGILGQKWGVRNGPPYPLKQHSASERIYKDASKRVTQITKDVTSAAKKLEVRCMDLRIDLKLKKVYPGR